MYAKFAGDGSKQTIITDETWKASYGPIREADLLQGSAYDARKEINGWDTTNFDDAKWQATDCAVDTWSALGLHNYMGSLWYRTTVAVPGGATTTAAPARTGSCFTTQTHLPANRLTDQTTGQATA